LSNQSSSSYLISIIGRDQTGVISAVSGYLFEIGANLADSAFAVLGEAFEFSCVAMFDGEMDTSELESGLAALELLGGARINVTRFNYDLERSESGEITHIVEISGGDRPGLVARISEVLVDYGANIVRMSSRRVPLADGAFDYRTRFAVNVTETRANALDNALVNIAGSLRLACRMDPA
jgi:glycine cleavage system transcriptional repressor